MERDLLFKTQKNLFHFQETYLSQTNKQTKLYDLKEKYLTPNICQFFFICI